ncbi:hypothetical protein OJ996_21645 [Luteolibacter sp. GHJ8]|jgi:hypothetical protein|uniref:Lipoprotein n=1 Tax=Luteolibacter rhizosphaerae TaxID=2989719 RepID=A0ABT3G9D1_9BACT|nr:hypothetical protein [Luteolibacter rhizosphaerae]MCW1916209.1 hypothetical protein [Luteolibacter rhizosphaerae]
MKISRCLQFSSIAFTAATLSSCVQYHNLPTDYSGPVAIVRGTSAQKNVFKGEGFTVSKVNGKMVHGRGTVATPVGGGPVLAVQEPEVRILPQPVTLTLTGSTVYAADGPALVDSMIGGSRHVSGDISFTPKAGGEYRVKGMLERGSESVWLVEEKSGKLIGHKIVK